MSGPKPFLFLDSPRVGEIGHSFLVVPQKEYPPEESLVALATRVRGGQDNLSGAVAAKHLVEQTARGMVRESDEWLICGGAAPRRIEDREIVAAILRRLLASSPLAQESQLEPGKRRSALVFEVPWLTAMAAEFEMHPAIRGIEWKPDEEMPRSPTTTAAGKFSPKVMLKWIVPLLLLIMLLTVVALIAGRVERDSTKGGSTTSSSSTPASTPVPPPEWKFLTDEEWNPLLTVTGGDRFSPVSDPESAGKWAEHIAKECGRKPFQGASSFRDDPRIIYVRNTLNATPTTNWFENQREQLQHQSNSDPDLKRLAESIQDFSTVFAHQSVASRRERLHELWQCFQHFAAESADDDSAPGALRKKWSMAPRDLSEPADADKFLTPLDAKRIAWLIEIFNSPEFAALAEQRPEARPAHYKWNAIVAFVNLGCVVQDQGAPDVKGLLNNLQAVFKEP